MNRKKFTILGETGSGKTCYLLGMYDELTMGIGKYTVIANNSEDAKRLRTNFNIMSDTTRGKGRFPNMTSGAQKINLDLQYGYETVLPFQWIDYPGEWLDPSMANFHDDQYKEVEKSIEQSDTLFICVDGENLTGKVDDKEKDEKKRYSKKVRKLKQKSLRNINPFLGKLKEKLKQEKKHLPPICIVITKFDLCEHDNTIEDFKKIISQAFEALFDEKNGNDFIVVIPVSLGEYLKHDNYSGEIEPINIHLPILFGVNFSLIEIIQTYRENIESKEREKNWYSDKLDEENDHWFDFMKDQSKIRSLSNDRNTISSQISELEKTVKLVNDKFDAINYELSNIEMFFFKGKWQTEINVADALRKLQKV